MSPSWHEDRDDVPMRAMTGVWNGLAIMAVVYLLCVVGWAVFQAVTG